MATNDLGKRVAALEKKLGMTAAPAPAGRQSLVAEIDELESRLGMSFMDDEVEDFGDADIVLEDPELDDPELDDLEVGCDGAGLGVEVGMDDELGTDELGMDDELAGLEEFCSGPMASRRSGSTRKGSEEKPGIEDEITQDSLREVEEEAHGTELTTDPSMLDTAPTGYTASAEYVARLQTASKRLDRVASYLETQGRKDMAARIDKIADAIDARVKNASRRA